MSGITTHVLDTSLGKPAVGVLVVLNVRDEHGVRELSRAETDADGRVPHFSTAAPLVAGVYQLSFESAAYFRASAREVFFERAQLEFRVVDATQHYHVPLLLTPFGYTTYRGT
jgi:5-hydroxyisourate hydrolase